MKEYSLHSEIKSLYSLPGDRFEVRMGNYIVDILRGDGDRVRPRISRPSRGSNLAGRNR